ncbi:Synaptogyrin-2 [Trichoplax sp. H2]|nr:Synaptogyrin-2 [Trichoplax sp. H2]|eukprot:RDD42089.1 Synaptogyrin-2 [Trichoplax sp. H2]
MLSSFFALSSGSFNIRNYVLKPQVILRFASWVFAIIVFGCLTSARSEFRGFCPLNGDNNACNYGIAIGVIAFLGLMVFLFLDAFVDRIIDLTTKKRIVIADLAFTSLWTLLWFIGFCYMTNKWSIAPKAPFSAVPGVVTNVNSALAFTFFSVLTWGALIYFGVQQYRNAENPNTQQQQAQPGYDYPNVGTSSQVPSQQTPSQTYQEPFTPQEPVTEEKKADMPPPYIPPNY